MGLKYHVLHFYRFMAIFVQILHVFGLVEPDEAKTSETFVALTIKSLGV